MTVKRFFAYCVDYFIVSLFATIFIMKLGTMQIYEISSDYPFLVIALVYMPAFLARMIIENPGAYGDISWVLPMFIIANIIEILYYTLIQLFFKGRTIGYMSFGLRLRYENVKLLLLRNTVKALSKYMFYIPCLTAVFDSSELSICDKIGRTYAEKI